MDDLPPVSLPQASSNILTRNTNTRPPNSIESDYRIPNQQPLANTYDKYSTLDDKTDELNGYLKINKIYYKGVANDKNYSHFDNLKGQYHPLQQGITDYENSLYYVPPKESNNNRTLLEKNEFKQH